jgi:hypothetical protein
MLRLQKEIWASLAVATQTTKITVTVHDKCLVKIEKAFNLWVEDIKHKKCIPNESRMLCRKALSL